MESTKLTKEMKQKELIEKSKECKEIKNNNYEVLEKLTIKNQKGITLLALITTVIVLLILAGITVGTITSENGIIKNTLSAKERTEIDNEIEVVEIATVQAMGKNKRGNIVKNELQEELDKITGKGKTIVTEDTEEVGYFVKFVDSGRIYKVSIDGDVEYLGKEDELLTRADIIANPESDTIPKLTQEVELTVKTLIDIGDVDYTLVYAWSSSQDTVPEDSKFVVAELEGEGRIRTTKVVSDVSAEGNYYLWVRAVVGEIEQEVCFGPYAIKDHTMLKRVYEDDSASDSGFLGNETVKRGLIKSITIQDTLGGHSLADENTWDVTESGNGRYLAWYEGDEENGYDVTIAGEGGVVANSNSAYLFRNIGSGITNGEVTITGLENLDTESVTGSMDSMFESCKASSLDLSTFDTSEVTSMYYMFANCTNLTNLNLSSFDTNNVKDMRYMFYNCSQLPELDLQGFDTKNVTDMVAMFKDCSNLEILNLSNKFETSKVTSMLQMFDACTSLTKLNVSSFNTENVTDMGSMFRNCKNLIQLDLSNFNTSKVTNMNLMFYSCTKLEELNVEKFNTSSVKNMSRMFWYCSSLKSLDVSSFNTSNVTNMERMLANCSSLKEIDISNFNTRNVTSMNTMFGGSGFIELDLSNFNTENVTDMGSMFVSCSSLINLDINDFDTKNVKVMNSMFQDCSNLTELDLSNFVTSNITNMNSMFRNCKSMTKLNISNFDTSNVTNMERMFINCNNLEELDLSSFYTGNVTDMRRYVPRLF